MGEPVRWLVGLSVAVLGVIIAWMAWQHPKNAQTVPVSAPTSAGITPSTAECGCTSPPPTVRNLEADQFQVGDCLTGSNLPLGTSNPWPDLAQAVPCSQAHTGEVFFADDSFWNNGDSYPGDNAASNAADTACHNEFESYVGISDSNSIYDWDSISPSATSWQNGDRDVQCVAYQQPGRYSNLRVN